MLLSGRLARYNPVAERNQNDHTQTTGALSAPSEERHFRDKSAGARSTGEVEERRKGSNCQRGSLWIDDNEEEGRERRMVSHNLSQSSKRKSRCERKKKRWKEQGSR
jgi:hypothetical protein